MTNSPNAPASKLSTKVTRTSRVLIRVRVEGNSAPDIATFAQPGLLTEFVKANKIVDLNTFMDADFLSGQYTPAFLELATVEGKMAGVWHNNDVKSIVWYPKAAFTEKGYTIPTTWDELIRTV